MAGLSTIKRQDTRFYVDPDTNEKVPGVTSVLNMVPKPFLQHWASKMTAEWCVDNAGAFVQLLINGQRQAAVDMAKGAARRSTSDAASVGTNVHDYFELYARGNAPKRPHPDVLPFVQHIEEFHDRYQPEYLFLEEAVWSDEHRYAGSFDWIAKIDGETVFGDVKTTRSGVHAEVSLQLAAYANADRIVLQDGGNADVPKADAGAVFHLRPGGWKLVPIRIDESVFSYFVVLRQVFDWVNDISKSVIGPADYDSQADESTGSQRRGN